MAKNSKKRSKAPARHVEPEGVSSISEFLDKGIAVHRQGNLGEAERNYQNVLRLDPGNAHALHLSGVVQHQSGNHKSAIQLIEQSLAKNTNFVDAHVNLGAAYYSDGNLARAEENFRRASELKPDHAGAHSNLAKTLFDLGRLPDAIASYLAARKANPSNLKFVMRLGELYAECGQPDDAIEQFEQYLQTAPDDVVAMNNLGCVFVKLCRYEEAETQFRRALELKPNSPDVANNLGEALLHLGRKAEANEVFKIAKDTPLDQWDNPKHTATSYARRGEYAKAISIFEKLAELTPNDADLLSNYGATLGKFGKTEDALAIFERALAIDPDLPEVHNNIGASKMANNDHEGAIKAFKEVIRIRPRDVHAHVNLTTVLLNEQRLDEAYLYACATNMLENFTPKLSLNAIKVFRGVCAYDDLADLGDTLEIMNSICTDDGLGLSPSFLEQMVITETVPEIKAFKALHAKWGAEISRIAEEFPLPTTLPRTRNSKIRIGFLSSDLRGHSVAKFVYPILKGYDKKKYEIFCYTPVEYVGDEVQKLIKGMVDGFRVVGNKSDGEIAKTIRDDNIDIQFELNGFTKDSKLCAMAYKPAPVQIYWLGYPYTTGMKEMDYILLDPYFRPEDDDFLVETPLMMKESWVCFGGVVDAHISEQTPFERNGLVTFGTLNNTYKFTPESIAAWARVMQGVPNSRFLLVRPECSSVVFCNNFAAEFEKHGIGRDRLEFVDNKAIGVSHFQLYNEIDLSLDTFPLVGGTTTCDALWMGVPVISLVGPNTHQRMGYSILNNVGVGELCAFSLDEYIEKGVMLANDPESLKQYRHGLRPAMLESPLCDADRYVDNFQKMLEGVIEKHDLR